jgi:phosphate transport system substrate-binding protein
MKKLLSLITTTLLLLTLAACGKGDSPAPSAAAPTPTATAAPTDSIPAPAGSLAALGAPDTDFAFTAGNFPVLDGSTAAIPLGCGVAEFFTGAKQEETLEKYPFAGTNDSLENLYSGFSDFLLVYDPPENTKELRAGIEYQPIGRDALVFLTHKDNPVQSLTAEQLKGIYEGKITNWKEVGGDDAEIIAYQRNYTSGSHTMFLKSFPAIDLAPAPADIVIGGMAGLIASVAAYQNDKYAIGYSVYYYADVMRADENIKLLSVGGVAPSNDTISSGAYPFLSDFYAAFMQNTQNPAVTALAKWFKTAQAKSLMQLYGYVPVSGE